MENRCVVCGDIIPEGRMVCPHCEVKKDDSVMGGNTSLFIRWFCRNNGNGARKRKQRQR